MHFEPEKRVLTEFNPLSGVLFATQSADSAKRDCPDWAVPVLRICRLLI